MDEVIKKETKTNQPCLWCAVDEGMLEQIFLVVDTEKNTQKQVLSTSSFSIVGFLFRI